MNVSLLEVLRCRLTVSVADIVFSTHHDQCDAFVDNDQRERRSEPAGRRGPHRVTFRHSKDAARALWYAPCRHHKLLIHMMLFWLTTTLATAWPLLL